MFGVNLDERKQGLYLTDVDKPDKIIKTLTVPNLHSRSSQCIVEWNPHPAKKSVIVSSVCFNFL